MPIIGPVPEKGPLHVTPSMPFFLMCTLLENHAQRRKFQDSDTFRRSNTADFETILYIMAVPVVPAQPRSRGLAKLEHGPRFWVLRRLVCAARCHPNRPPAARPGRARGPSARLKGAQPCHECTRTAGSVQAIVWAVRSRRQCAGRLLAAGSRHTVVRPAAGLCAPPLPSQAQPMGTLDASVHETAYHLITAAPKVRSGLSTPPPHRAHALVSRA